MFVEANCKWIWEEFVVVGCVGFVIFPARKRGYD